MYQNKKVVVVLPAYNAAKTLRQTVEEVPSSLVDEIILCDDASSDETISVAREIGIKYVIKHDMNLGYGANQKSLYNKALELNAEIIVMLHPDYQYTPALIPSMVSLIGDEVFPVVLGSRILGTGALKGGMPFYKYVSNRILTTIQNLLANYKLSEYHTGYRAYSNEVLQRINYNHNSDDFVFDNEVLAQIIESGFTIAEVSCPTRYTAESSSISFKRSVKYGLGVLRVSLVHFLHRKKIVKSRLFQKPQ